MVLYCLFDDDDVGIIVKNIGLFCYDFVCGCFVCGVDLGIVVDWDILYNFYCVWYVIGQCCLCDLCFKCFKVVVGG